MMLPWNAEDLTFDEARFSGSARLFPLPDLVMFPHVMQPLHIFEPRYREMLNEALDSDGLIAMSMLAPGWELDDEDRPALLPHVCLGKVITHHRLDDGRYNVMLLGMRRGRIIAESPSDRMFRRAEVELLDDVYPVENGASRGAVQAALTKIFHQSLPIPKGGAAEGPVKELLASEIPLGVLTDLVSFALPLDVELKRRLLADSDVDRRAAALLKSLDASLKASEQPATKLKFPPRFSLN